MADTDQAAAETAQSSGADAPQVDAQRKNAQRKYVDQGWPRTDDGDHEHAVSEFAAPISGALSPFGEVEFPLPAGDLPYVHAKTTPNR